jgi:hypothetical protein
LVAFAQVGASQNAGGVSNNGQSEREFKMKEVQNTELELVSIEELEPKIAPSSEAGFLD